MTAADTLLVQLLAESDALFVPVRDWTGTRSRATAQRRSHFVTKGVEWASGAAGEDARKAAQRTLAALDSEGMVSVGRVRGRAMWVRLTDAGEDRARALASLPRLDAGVLSVHAIAARSDRKAKTMDRALVSIVDLAGGHDPHELRAVEDMALPALLRGWICCGSDVAGRVYFWLSVAGWGIAQRPPDVDLPDVDGDPQAIETYDSRIQAALDWLGSAPVVNPMEIGPLPIPVSHAGTPWGGSLRQAR